MKRAALPFAVTILVLALVRCAASAAASPMKAPIRKFDVYEVLLRGEVSARNPFDAVVTAEFVPPSGRAQTVHAFYDGADLWRARVYVSETGEWRWSSRCTIDRRLDGQSGSFTASGSSKSRGRLLPHSRNSRQWMTEDGRWFLNLSDTAYFLLSPHDASGAKVSDDDVKEYVRDASNHGITSLRCFSMIGPKGFLEGGSGFMQSWRDAIFENDELNRLRLDHFQVADRRLRWLLDDHPEIYVQFILFPRGSRWRQDDQLWNKFTLAQKEQVMRYMIARYAAYPQLFWLIVNDAHYAPDRIVLPGQADMPGAFKAAAYPNNIALAREVGSYFRQHDPWQHPLSTGAARQVDFIYGNEPWATYIHLEDAHDLGATRYEEYHRFGKPVFLGEDRYEQSQSDRDPRDMNYFQRRLFWSWLLAGGSANYGGRWWVVHPYSQTGRRATRPPRGGQGTEYTARLTGLDSVRFIRDYFTVRGIELSEFEPAPALVQDSGGAKAIRAPKLMRRGDDEFLIYHPNAAADGRDACVDAATTPSVVVNLNAVSGTFAVEWYRVTDGTAKNDGVVEAGGFRTLRSPWHGEDCVVRLRRG